MKMHDEGLPSVGAKNMDTSGNQVSDLEDIEFHWEDPDLEMEAVIRPGIDTPFSPSTSNDFEMVFLAEIPILVDEEYDKENFPPLPTTPVSGRPTQNTFWTKRPIFGTKIENVPDYFYKIMFQ